MIRKHKKKYRILLTEIFNSDFHEGRLGEIPLGLVSIGTLLKNNGYDPMLVGLIDTNLKEIDKFITEDTLCVGISVKTLQVKASLELSQYLKKNYPWIKIVWGGIHSNLYPKQPLEEDSVDISVFGDGEYTMLEIVDSLKNKKSLKGIEGCAFKNGKKIVINKPRPAIDISKLPKYDFSIIPNLEEYINVSKGQSNFHGENYMVIQTAIGCPFNCSFCYNTIKGRRQEREINKILDEIDFFIKNYNIKFFRLNDELFLANRERIKNFLIEKRKRKMNFFWESTGHALFLRDEKFYSDDFLKELINEGLVGTTTGAESGSQEQLKRYRKNITPQDILMVAKRMEDFKIKILFSFMIGAPYEKYEEMIETIKLIYNIKSIAPNYAIVQYPQIYRPYPGADLYKDAINLGFKNREHLRDWMKVSQFTGYTSYSDLPYLEAILPKIYDLLYYYKLIKAMFSLRFLRPILKRKNVSKVLCSNFVISNGGHLTRKILENKIFDNLISQKVFKRSLINRM